MSGRKADAIVAAYNAMEVAMRMLRPGQHKNMEITDTIQKIVSSYDCKPIENMLSHQLKRNKIGKVTICVNEETDGLTCFKHVYKLFVGVFFRLLNPHQQS